VCPLCVLLFEIGAKRVHTVTQGDTQALTKSKTYNKTGDLDIFQVSLSRREPGFKSRWDHQHVRGRITLWPFFSTLFPICSFLDVDHRFQRYIAVTAGWISEPQFAVGDVSCDHASCTDYGIAADGNAADYG